MSTLPVVEKILREVGEPMSVRQIVEYAKGILPTKSKTPDTVVARDLAMDIKRRGGESPFARVAPGRYTMRVLAELSPEHQVTREDAGAPQEAHHEVHRGTDQVHRPDQPADETRPTDMLAAAMKRDRAGTLPASTPARTGESSESSSSTHH